MKLKFAVLGMMLGLGFSAAQAQVETMISVPVKAGEAEMTNSVLNGGAFLNLKPLAGGSLRLKCHQGFTNGSFMVFMSGKIFSTQLSGAVEDMSSCLADLEDLRQSMMNGAEMVQIEVRSDHTLRVSAVKK